MMKYLYLILFCFLFISCSKKEVGVFEDVDIYYSISLSEDLNNISNIKTVFNTPLSSGLFREERTNKAYNIEITDVKCPTDINLSVIFERKEDIDIYEELGLKKTRSYRIVRNFSDGSSLDRCSFELDLGSIPKYDFNGILEYFETEGEEKFILHLDTEGN